MMTIDDYKSLTDPTFVRLENYYIICGNYSEYIEHVNAKHTFKPLTKRLLFVTDRETFRGTVNPEGIFIGGWRDRLDIHNLLISLSTKMTDPKKAQKIKELYKSLPIACTYVQR